MTPFLFTYERLFSFTRPSSFYIRREFLRMTTKQLTLRLPASRAFFLCPALLASLPPSPLSLSRRAVAQARTLTLIKFISSL